MFLLLRSNGSRYGSRTMVVQSLEELDQVCLSSFIAYLVSASPRHPRSVGKAGLSAVDPLVTFWQHKTGCLIHSNSGRLIAS